MEIRVELAGVRLGPYSEKQVRDYLADGLVSLDDLACIEGTDEWKPVRTVLEKVPAAEVRPAPEPAEQVPEETGLSPDEADIAGPAPQIELPVVAKMEAPVDTMEDTQPLGVSPPTQVFAATPQNRPTALTLPLEVKSLAKKKSQVVKAIPGPVSLGSWAKASENPPPTFSAPIKVLTKKGEFEIKPKLKPILKTAPSAGSVSTLPAAITASDLTKVPATPNSKASALMSGTGKDVKASPTSLSVAPAKEKPKKITLPSQNELLTLAQFLESEAPPRLAPPVVLKSTGPLAKLSDKDGPPATSTPPIRESSGRKTVVAAPSTAPREYLYWLIIVLLVALVLVLCAWLVHGKKSSPTNIGKSESQSRQETRFIHGAQVVDMLPLRANKGLRSLCIFGLSNSKKC